MINVVLAKPFKKALGLILTVNVHGFERTHHRFLNCLFKCLLTFATNSKLQEHWNFAIVCSNPLQSIGMHEQVALDILHHCDRTRSKEARYALTILAWRPLRAHNIYLQPDCILSGEGDILRRQEALKHQLNSAAWNCEICGKIFKTEHHLDMHLARRHGNERHNNGTVCLADLCGVAVPCVPLDYPPLSPVSTAALAALAKQNNNVRVTPAVTPLPSVCTDEVARRRRVQSCTHIVSECLHSSQHQESSHFLQRHVDRLRVELCERSISVGCIPRHSVYTALGPADAFLRTNARFCTFHTVLFGSVIFVLILVLSCIKLGSAKKSMERRRRTQKPEKRRKRQNQSKVN